jgi:hypothetical protein
VSIPVCVFLNSCESALTVFAVVVPPVIAIVVYLTPSGVSERKGLQDYTAISCNAV